MIRLSEKPIKERNVAVHDPRFARFQREVTAMLKRSENVGSFWISRLRVRQATDTRKWRAFLSLVMVKAQTPDTDQDGESESVVELATRIFGDDATTTRTFQGDTFQVEIKVMEGTREPNGLRWVYDGVEVGADGIGYRPVFCTPTAMHKLHDPVNGPECDTFDEAETLIADQWVKAIRKNRDTWPYILVMDRGVQVGRYTLE